MSEDQARSTSAENTPPLGEGGAVPCADPVVVMAGWLVIDGCKVARVERGGVITFPDKCRGRSERRGRCQVRVRVVDLARAVEANDTLGNESAEK